MEAADRDQIPGQPTSHTQGTGGQGTSQGNKGNRGNKGQTPAIPIIFNSSLAKSGSMEYIGSGFKIRVSEATPRDSVILPTCGVAALVVSFPNFTGHNAPNYPSPTTPATIPSSPPNKETLDELIVRIRSFTRIHNSAVVILVGSVFGADEMLGVLGPIQTRLLPHPPPILPAHGVAQAAAHIQVLAKTVAHGRKKVMLDRMMNIVTRTVDDPLLPSTLGPLLGLSPAQMMTALGAFGSLSGVAEAGEEGLKRAGLSARSVSSLMTALNRDTMTL